MKVPSVCVFVSTNPDCAFSSRRTDAPTIGVPAEFRTVPSIVIAPDSCGEALCAGVGALDRLTSATAKIMRLPRHLFSIVLDEGRKVGEQFMVEAQFSRLHPE